MGVLGKLLAGYAYAQNAGTQATSSSFQRTYVDLSNPHVFLITPFGPSPSRRAPVTLGLGRVASELCSTTSIGVREPLTWRVAVSHAGVNPTWS